MSRPGLRATALTVLCGLALLLGAGSASAHTKLDSSDPADGTTLDTAPAQVSLTFNEAMQAGFATVTLIGPDGTAYQTGEPTVSGAVVGSAVAPLGPAGRYEIGYRVVSEDGHPVTGSVAFMLTTPGPGAAPAAAAPPAATGAPTETPTSAPAIAPAAASSPASAPIWPWLVGAVVLIGGAVLAALRLGRS